MEEEEYINSLSLRLVNIANNLKRFSIYLDRQILKNFKDAEIETRAKKSNGLWCCFLIPTILILYSVMYEVSPLYKQMAYQSVGMLSYSILFIIFTSISCLVVKEQAFAGCIAASLLCALLLYMFHGIALMTALVLAMCSVYPYSFLLNQMLLSFPKTFTIGELMIVLQSSVLCLNMGVVQVFMDNTIDTETHLIASVVLTVLSTVGLIVTAVYMIDDEYKTVQYLAYIVTGAVLWALVILNMELGRSCIFVVLNYIFLDPIKVQLVVIWLVLLCLSVLIMIVRTRLGKRVSSTMRKAFHILASIVFTSGILVDVQFMRLAAGVALGVLILAEALRKSGIEPISSALQAVFEVYKDEKDSGFFALTPIYLYLGLACPLVIVPDHRGSELELLSGVLATGVGDTAASWFGERYGKTKWAGGNKSLEGTVFNALSQILAVYGLGVFELLNARFPLLRTSVAATVSALVEARTEQVDNIVLPLVTIIAFQATFFLA